MYLGEVDETLECMVCHEPLVDPVVEPNCRVTFCRRCVSPWVAEKHSCPSCRGPASVAQLHPAPRIIIQLLDALPVACPTCNGRHQRGNLARHIQLCPKRTAHMHRTRTPLMDGRGCRKVIRHKVKKSKKEKKEKKGKEAKKKKKKSSSCREEDKENSSPVRSRLDSSP